jgi:tellurite resistance protein TehA-like permease
MTIKELILYSSFTFRKIFHSIKMIKQSSKRSSFILFLNLFLTTFIVETALLRIAVATARINTNLRSKYNKLHKKLNRSITITYKIK